MSAATWLRDLWSALKSCVRGRKYSSAALSPRLEVLEGRCVPTVTAVNDAFTTAPNTNATLNVLANDTGSPVSTLQLGVTTPVSPSGPTLTSNADGTLTFNSLTTGTYTFDYTAIAAGAQQQVTAPDGATNDDFGWAVAASGNTAVVAANSHHVATGYSGAVYVFTLNGSTWTFQQELTGADSNASTLFGTSVAISGNTIVVGSPFDNVGSNSSQGDVFVFTRSGTTWTQQQILTSSDGGPNDEFGRDVAIDGSTIVVGAYQHQVGSTFEQGAAYVFTGNGSTWTQQQELTASDGAVYDKFGSSVAINGSTIAASSALGTCVFTNNGTGWSQQQLLSQSGSLAIDGTTLVVGEGDLAATNSSTQNGAAFVYTLSGTTWALQQELVTTVDTNSADDDFGASVALNGDTLLVGDSGHGENNGLSGAAYVFTRSGTTWTEQQELTATGPSGGALFGNSVAITGETFVIGANSQTISGNSGQGAAYFQDWSAATATATVNVTTSTSPPPASPPPAQTLPISSIGPQTVADGSTLAITVTATSPDGAPVTFSLGTGAPQGATINAQTGAFSWTPSEWSNIAPGVYTLSVSAIDSSDAQVVASGTFTVTVGPSSTDQGSGMAARNTVALGLTQSAEYYTNFITAAYNKYLGRAPDANGLAYWLNLMQNQGLSDEHLEAGFIGSQEYIADHGGAGQGWIVGMYQNLLGRTPAQSEVQYWLNQLAAGESTSDIAYGFAASEERESERVAADYTQYLGRSASASEIQYWVNVFENGGSNEQVIAGFISSQEYFQDHGNNIVDWLFAGYRAVLNRLPDSSGFQYWENQLQ